MKKAIDETNRRRSIQEAYNERNGIIPHTVVKPVEDAIRGIETKEMTAKYLSRKTKMSKQDMSRMIADLEKEMRDAAKVLDFERAAQLRDIIFELKSED